MPNSCVELSQVLLRRAQCGQPQSDTSLQCKKSKIIYPLAFFLFILSHNLAYANYISSCEASAVEAAASNAKLLFDTQNRISPGERASVVKAPVSIFAVSDEDKIEEKVKLIVSSISKEVDSALIEYGGIDLSNDILIIVKNMTGLDNSRIRTNVSEKIYDIMIKKNQSPIINNIKKFVNYSFDVAKDKIKDGELIHLTSASISNAETFSLFFFAGRQADSSEPFISDKALSEFILLNLGVPPIAEFKDSIASKGALNDAITPADLALVRIIMLSPEPSKWGEGLTALRSKCLNPEQK
jgi:hypothetical protein